MRILCHCTWLVFQYYMYGQWYACIYSLIYRALQIGQGLGNNVISDSGYEICCVLV